MTGPSAGLVLEVDLDVFEEISMVEIVMGCRRAVRTAT